ncbi:DNA-binding transcriptional regulator of sugar metabolism, DeoR/GlpR family [Tranquillimonas rosea]|uniref:DNA-binding transcriptional regulator of sugar metabolism, DeoR/GlpR family n=1 Tax=Tranquillimonas rosea TaxID=641238 RepID=A0A1H9WVN1_9RHOB|nr:DeoR/GlpR family DNA-binding transcription regulator [Tranquillimonas rosea]SES37483.1 DNA-binding transcriptional regulator of sugar metabolism, DeoR/GlpR family [Tranquillimonas rosea]
MEQQNEPRRFKKQERHEQILLQLKLKPHVRVAELAAQFGVTTETARRDIEELSRDGLLSRAHGGASAAHPGTHRDLHERRLEHIAERERLGRFAASLVSDGDTIMVDAGSTTMEFARFLAFAETRVTVITNSLQVAMTLGQSPCARLRLAPGEYLPHEAAVVGTETCEYLAAYNVDACFIGAAGLSEAGVTEAVEGFGAVKRAMLRQSRSRRFLIDASKFGETHLTHVAGFDGIGTLVSDRPPAPPLSDRLAAQGVEVLAP